MQTNPQTANHTPCSRNPIRRGAHGPNNLSGPSSSHPQHPSSELLSRSRARCRGTNLRFARGLHAPRVNLCLARGLRAPSGESPPRSRALRVRDRRTHSPDRSIKCSNTPRAPGSKANPCHVGPLTPPGNRIPTLFRQPSPCGHP
jgi:hypothetical protein